MSKSGDGDGVKYREVLPSAFRDCLLRAAATAVLAPPRQPSSCRRDRRPRAAATAFFAPPRLLSSRRRVCCRRAAGIAFFAPPRLPSSRDAVFKNLVCGGHGVFVRAICADATSPISKFYQEYVQWSMIL
jgi:hypothetical protein